MGRKLLRHPTNRFRLATARLMEGEAESLPETDAFLTRSPVAQAAGVPFSRPCRGDAQKFAGRRPQLPVLPKRRRPFSNYWVGADAGGTPCG